MDNFWVIFGKAVASIGGAGVLILGFSSFLGKVWANRIMESDRAKYVSELEKLRASLQSKNEREISTLTNGLEIFKSQYLTTRNDKVTIYRYAIETVATLLANMDRFYTGVVEPNEIPNVRNDFNLGRMKVWAYLAMLAPQPVIDAIDALFDYLLMVIGGSASYEWKTKIRPLILKCINEIRKDIGIDKTPIEYKGSL